MRNQEYHYKNILLLQRYSDLNSRADASTEIKFGPRTFKLPVVPANMKSVINEELCIWLAQNNYFYTMHRFGIDNLVFCETMRDLGLYTSISAGVNTNTYQSLKNIAESEISPDYITIDIAQGFSLKMRNMIHYIRHLFPNTFLIAGNVCTKEGVEFLEENGADSVKVGIGPGCFTLAMKVNTKNGLKAIGDIVIGDFVYTHHGRLKEVVNILNFEINEEIVVINGIESTEKHEYFVINKKHENIVNESNIQQYAHWIQATYLNEDFLLVEFDKTKFKFKKIECIERKHYKGKVRDLTVKDDHSYNIENIIVHNSVCTTKLQTGFSRPQFSAVLDCCSIAKKPIVADGGIEHNGDIAKALVAGASMVMAGGIFSGYKESTGDCVEINGIMHKEYYGSASEFNKGEKRHVEGKKILVPLRGSIVDKYREIEQSLRSSISYAGGRDLDAFKNVEWIVQD